MATASEVLKSPLVRRGVAFPGYSVGDDGVIYTRWKFRGSGPFAWKIGETDVPLRTCEIGKNGAYHGVSLRFGGRTIRASVHTLVMEAFRGPCPEGLEVCHEDGNGHHNWLSNLRYGTKASNQADKRRHGTHQDGERNPSATLTNEQAAEVRRLRNEDKLGLQVIAERFGIRESTVSRIANGVRRAS